MNTNTNFCVRKEQFLIVRATFIICAMCICPPAEGFHHPPSLDRQVLRPTVDFFAGEIKGVLEGEERTASFGIQWQQTNATDVFALYKANTETDFVLSVMSEDAGILEIVSSPHEACIRYNDGGGNITFSVKGVFVGYTKIVASLDPALQGCPRRVGHFAEVSFDEPESRSFSLPVSVIRSQTPIVNVMMGFMVALVAFNYINMGVQLSLQNVGAVLKKPVGPCIGFFCQFLFMPLASFGVGYLLFDDVSYRLGLFTLGCSPGGSMSNFWTLLFGGDLDLSITMTFISTFAALGMMPLWIFTLGRTLFRDRDAAIPYLNLTGSLVMLTVPVGVGLLIRQYSPRLAKISEAVLKPLCVFVIVVGISFTLYVNRYVFYLFTWQIIIAGMSIAWGGYCFGALVAWMARLRKQQIIAVSIETAMQNPGVAFVLLLMSLPQPEADLTLVPVIAQIMVTGLPMYLLLVTLKIRSCFLREDKRKNDGEMDLTEAFSDKDYLPLQTKPERLPVIVPSTACIK